MSVQGLILATSAVFAGLGAVLHGMAGVMAWGAGMRGTKRVFWWVVAAVQVVLGVDAAVGLRMMIRDWGRALFRTEGWYGERWEPLAIASGVVVLTMAAAGVALMRMQTKEGCRRAAAGTMLSAGLMVLGIMSLHQVDEALTWPVGWANAGLALRGVAVGMAIWGAWSYQRAEGSAEKETGKN